MERDSLGGALVYRPGLGGSSGRNAGGKRFCNGGPGSAGSQPDGGAKYGADGSREGSENVQLSTRYV